MNKEMNKQTSFRTSDYVWSKFKLICTMNGDNVGYKLNELINKYVDDNMNNLMHSIKESSNMDGESVA